MGLMVPYRRHLCVGGRVLGSIAVIGVMLWALAEDIDSAINASILRFQGNFVLLAESCEETHALNDRFLISAYQKHLECKESQAAFATGSAKGTKFFVPAQLNEQLSKAVGHFADIAVIGAALNRTLVLPRVGQGEISIDLALPFGSYFELMSLRELVWITSEQLVARQSAGPEKLTGAYVFLTHGRYACSSMLRLLRVSVLAEAERMAETSDYTCYNGTDLLTSGDDVLVRGKAVEAALSEALKQVNVVFLVKEEMYYWASSLTEKVAAIESKLYNHHPLFFEDLTTRFIEKHLGFNYLALQWRTEKCFRQPHCDGAFFGFDRDCNGYDSGFRSRSSFPADSASPCKALVFVKLRGNLLFWGVRKMYVLPKGVAGNMRDDESDPEDDLDFVYPEKSEFVTEHRASLKELMRIKGGSQ
ncbi:hypothetical protein KFL_007400030 [Klebsormidium nitens]|uniref:Uncharacterized protein n=1 Tax=Klebsormidium nitens TaxID=105231 RepID=A0A1Y1IRC8_KLENI|nr:hypothetical protein KFL_007400030 [Klebsormidium nitens]|eukprot:GAQ91187.1 hypothetical protein KFL_007400030 [Klebsormidium nitens]